MKSALLVFIAFFFATEKIYSQKKIPFEKHGVGKNILTGHKLGYEIPFQLGHILTNDYDYEDPLTKGLSYLGAAAKITLKNGWGRGIGLGVGLDITSSRYIRLNLLLDLDFLFAYSIPMSEKTMFSPSMFTKFELTKIIAQVDGVAVQEYYFSFNVIKMQFGKIAGEMGTSIGLFRNKHVPHFADKGLYYRLSYIISK